jgi:16S rRNA (guanine527-N7)-methyltransferase
LIATPMQTSPKAVRERDKAHALELMNLPPRIVERLEIYERLLIKWQAVENLVASGSLDHVWTRHFADSAQILGVVPLAARWVDLGSGAGFPGMVLAILLSDRADAAVHLIESHYRKCAFLRDVSRETSAGAIIHHGRIETIAPRLDNIEAVTARALAPLRILLDYAEPLLKTGAIGVFLKGQNVEAELTALRRSDNLKLSLKPSMTDRTGQLVVVQPVVSSPASS